MFPQAVAEAAAVDSPEFAARCRALASELETTKGERGAVVAAKHFARAGALQAGIVALQAQALALV